MMRRGGKGRAGHKSSSADDEHGKGGGATGSSRSTTRDDYDDDDDVAMGKCDDGGSASASALYDQFEWEVVDLSKITDEYIYSDVFSIGGFHWRLLMYPRGNNNKSKALSVYLCVPDFQNLDPGWSRLAHFTLAVVNQRDGTKTHSCDGSNKFRKREHDWGFQSLMELSKLHDPSNGFLVDDKLILQAKVQVVSHLFMPMSVAYRKELCQRHYKCALRFYFEEFLEEKSEEFDEFWEDNGPAFLAFWAELAPAKRAALLQLTKDGLVRKVRERLFSEKHVDCNLALDVLYNAAEELRQQALGHAVVVPAGAGSAAGPLFGVTMRFTAEGIVLLIDSGNFPEALQQSRRDTLRIVKETLAVKKKTASDPVETDEVKVAKLEEVGRRMLHVFAMELVFSEQLMSAFREKIARVRQEELIREEEDEKRRDGARKQAKKEKNAKKKEKEKRQQQVHAEQEERAKAKALAKAAKAAAKQQQSSVAAGAASSSTTAPSSSSSGNSNNNKASSKSKKEQEEAAVAAVEDDDDDDEEDKDANDEKESIMAQKAVEENEHVEDEYGNAANNGTATSDSSSSKEQQANKITEEEEEEIEEWEKLADEENVDVWLKATPQQQKGNNKNVDDDVDVIVMPAASNNNNNYNGKSNFSSSSFSSSYNNNNSNHSANKKTGQSPGRTTLNQRGKDAYDSRDDRKPAAAAARKLSYREEENGRRPPNGANDHSNNNNNSSQVKSANDTTIVVDQWTVVSKGGKMRSPTISPMKPPSTLPAGGPALNLSGANLGAAATPAAGASSSQQPSPRVSVPSTSSVSKTSSSTTTTPPPSSSSNTQPDWGCIMVCASAAFAHILRTKQMLFRRCDAALVQQIAQPRASLFVVDLDSWALHGVYDVVNVTDLEASKPLPPSKRQTPLPIQVTFELSKQYPSLRRQEWVGLVDTVPTKERPCAKISSEALKRLMDAVARDRRPVTAQQQSSRSLAKSENETSLEEKQDTILASAMASTSLQDKEKATASAPASAPSATSSLASVLQPPAAAAAPTPSLPMDLGGGVDFVLSSEQLFAAVRAEMFGVDIQSSSAASIDPMSFFSLAPTFPTTSNNNNNSSVNPAAVPPHSLSHPVSAATAPLHHHGILGSNGLSSNGSNLNNNNSNNNNNTKSSFGSIGNNNNNNGNVSLPFTAPNPSGSSSSSGSSWGGGGVALGAGMLGGGFVDGDDMGSLSSNSAANGGMKMGMPQQHMSRNVKASSASSFHVPPPQMPPMEFLSNFGGAGTGGGGFGNGANSFVPPMMNNNNNNSNNNNNIGNNRGGPGGGGRFAVPYGAGVSGMGGGGYFPNGNNNNSNNNNNMNNSNQWNAGYDTSSPNLNFMGLGGGGGGNGVNNNNNSWGGNSFHPMGGGGGGAPMMNGFGMMNPHYQQHKQQQQHPSMLPK